MIISLCRSLRASQSSLWCRTFNLIILWDRLPFVRVSRSVRDTSSINILATDEYGHHWDIRGVLTWSSGLYLLGYGFRAPCQLWAFEESIIDWCPTTHRHHKGHLVSVGQSKSSSTDIFRITGLWAILAQLKPDFCKIYSNLPSLPYLSSELNLWAQLDQNERNACPTW